MMTTFITKTTSIGLALGVAAIALAGRIGADRRGCVDRRRFRPLQGSAALIVAADPDRAARARR